MAVPFELYFRLCPQDPACRTQDEGQTLLQIHQVAQPLEQPFPQTGWAPSVGMKPLEWGAGVGRNKKNKISS